MNRLLAAQLADRFEGMGLETDMIDLAEFPMAIYHGDDEAVDGAPTAAVELHDRLALADGLVVVTPEYNGGPPAILKNSLDWVTRVDRAVFKRLLVGVACTSPGPRGGQAVLAAMHAMFTHMRLEIHEPALSVPSYREAFDDADTRRLVRPDAVESTDAFVGSYTAALASWVDSGRGALV